jgi:hypothetical protein
LSFEYFDYIQLWRDTKSWNRVMYYYIKQVIGESFNLVDCIDMYFIIAKKFDCLLLLLGNSLVILGLRGLVYLSIRNGRTKSGDEGR